MDINKLYENLLKARDENVPKGVEFAWCDVNNNHVKWDDLVEAISLLVDPVNPTNVVEEVSEPTNEQE